MAYKKKYIYIVFIVTLFLLSSFISSSEYLISNKNSLNKTIINQMNNEPIIYVDDDNVNGPWDGTINYPYQTISEALSSSSDGYTIYVFNGMYTGFKATKKINLIGESNQDTIIKVWYANEKVELRSDEINFSNFKLTGRKIGWRSAFIDAIGNDITISNLTIDGGGNDVGIKPGGEYWYTGNLYKNRITVSDCYITNSGFGVYLYLALNCVIKNCELYDNYCGVYIMDFSIIDGFHNIYNCEIYENEDGIKIYDMKHNTISNCNIHNNSRGINFDHANFNYVTSSNIQNNNVGITGSWENNNKILGNIIKNNNIGINFKEKGIHNNIYHNNFVNNFEQHAKDTGDSFWDNGEEGNYWDDYTGGDSNGDGIGDTPYIIDEGKRDNYPLVNYFSMDEKSPLSPVINIVNIGKQWVEYEAEVLSLDTNYDTLYYLFDWGDGTNSGWVGPFGYEIYGNAKHKWTKSGNYDVKVKARDVTGKESQWSYSTIIIESNNKPNQPILINSPMDGIVGYPVDFEIKSTDRDGDEVRFYIFWGNKKVDVPDEWTNYYESGETLTISHIWGDWYNKIESQKTFNIELKSQDIYGADSECTYYEITIINNPPIAPIIKEAPDEIKVGEVFEIKVTSADPDLHKIAFEVEWGNGGKVWTNTFIDSWKNCTISSDHGGYFSNKGNYTLRVRAYDYFGAEGDWTEHKFTVKEKSKNKDKKFSFINPIKNLLNKLFLIFNNRNIKMLQIFSDI